MNEAISPPLFPSHPARPREESTERIPVSVLMPVYNARSTLGECLDSIAAQTLSAIEVVVVDDGSTDGSGEIVEAHARRDPRFRLLRQSHAGIVRALNRGLEACQGRYIARIDADDLMHPQRLQRQFDHMAQHPHLDLIGTQVGLFSRNGSSSSGALRYVAWQNALLDDAAIRLNMFVESPIAHPTFFVRRELMQQLGGYEDPTWWDDYDLLFRAALAGAKFGKVPAVLVQRGDDEGRMTKSDPRARRSSMFRAKIHYLLRSPIVGGDEARRRPLIIWGSGPSGRGAIKALRNEGVAPEAIIDDIPHSSVRTVMGIPAYGFDGAPPAGFLASQGNALILLCIGESVGRTQSMAALAAAGLREGHEYLRLM